MPSSTMKNSHSTISFLFFFLFIIGLGLVSCDSASSLQDKCSPAFTKLGECLSFASAKADAPSSACCGSVGEIREKNAVCLCFIIQQAHAPGSSAASLGLQLDRLIKLPSACKIANTNISDCPTLLNLPPNSPDNAIFTNTTKATTPSAPSGTSTPSGSTSSGSITSKGIMNKMNFVAKFAVAMISAAFCLSMF